ncbi:MAG: HAMP domain-containing sensor histidine kinase [Prevotellaceae bacterium]|nr:HAMP domain-containing sensor histidine kinase [Prevotellaceae bacterium]
MKLQTVLTFRLSMLKAVLITVWAVFFYFAVMDKINEEMDDSLMDYAETLIMKYLAGEQLPATFNGTDNRYYLHQVSDKFAKTHEHIRYYDEEVYFNDMNDYEPARKIAYIFITDDNRYMQLVVFTPTIDKKDLKQAIFYWLVALYVLIILGVFGVNFWTVRKSMKPLHKLLKWLDEYKLGNNSKPLDNDTDITEFKKLNAAVKSSTERNERQYEQQKMFIANASHEMQTPLAVIQNRLEILLEDENLTEQQLNDIVKTLHTLKSLTATNRSLLLLCKIENGHFTDLKHISISEKIERMLPDYEAIYAYKGITVEKDISPLYFEMDESLSTTLVGNLLKNAFTHNINGGSIVITIRENLLEIRNSGVKEPLDDNKIFDSFYHTAGKKSSTGLGLALVKAICRLYNLEIKYQYVQDMHVFRVSINKEKRDL